MTVAEFEYELNESQKEAAAADDRITEYHLPIGDARALIDDARASAGRYRNVALEVASWLESLSSSDGSGHADLGRRAREMIAKADSESGLGEVSS